ncbi:MAG: PIG-L family deacetylase [Candidatus Magasanikbacteria bacterium]|nr:PIG-L family deacetylase [Candidatus Magasanikbacteria bacterium]
MAKNILVVAAHPDDELLGLAGTLINHVRAGDNVRALILGQGVLSRDGADTKELGALQAQAKRAGEIVGFTDMRFLSFRDNAFDSVPLLEIAKEVERFIAAERPDIVYTHHEYDLNVDHRLTFQAVLTASRPCNNKAPREILTFETLSSTEWQSKDHKTFMPTVYHDIEATMDQKIQALSMYESEMREYPHPRSAEGLRILAQFRGLESGLKYAEAFHLVRKIA